MQTWPWAVLLVSATGVSACSDDDEPAVEPTSSAADGGGGAGGSGGSSPIETAVDVSSYQFRFDVTTSRASSRLSTLAAAPGGTCTTLDCSIGLDEMSWNDAPAAFEQDEVSVRACGVPVPEGAALDLDSRQGVPEALFHGLDVGWSHRTSLAGGTFSYLLSWVGGCHHFGPCDAHPGRLAAFDVEVTHPADTVALCAGELLPGATTTRCQVSGTLAPTYSAFFLAADTSWVRTPYATLSGVDLVFYEAPGGTLAQSLDLQKVSLFFEWITSLLGPYPYGSELRVAGAPTRWLGFEHPANIILHERLDERLLDYADGLLHVFLHEVVHQWAGARTTLASAADFVWKEAIAEYLTYVFEDEQLFQGEASASLAYWDAAALYADYHPRPTDEPVPEVWHFYGDAYGPGPMVLFVQLESMLGRGTVLQAIAAFLSEPVARSVSDLRLALEEESGAQLGPYFDAWVFGAGAPSWPLFAATLDQTGDQVTVTLTQQSESDELYGCAVEVLVQGATSAELAVVDFGLAPTSDTASATITLAETAVSESIDPHHRVVNRSSSAAAVAPAPRAWIF
ncbi:MAG: hypothetical protein JRI23_24115 [Deltaproteobacteria bacterium]|jgi:aminopeptidase N|nr:hypothetical protein [Deltaproteobacteria bacterium]MBW2535083.1 hypothetical protein [Deltaproteobacteria bacterium]